MRYMGILRALSLIVIFTMLAAPQLPPASFDNSLVLTPLYVGYATDPPEKFAREAAELKQRIGFGKHILIGFAAFLDLAFPEMNLDDPVTPERLAPTLKEVDTIVDRARAQGLVVHISIVSGFFHSWNALRHSAILQDVRNAQWFVDGWIAPPDDLRDPASLPRSVWITPSRYALPLRSRIEEGVRILGRHLAQKMAQFPDTLVTVSGDGEVEFTWERNFASQGERVAATTDVIYTDYSPFMVEEFRDWLRTPTYSGDLSPGTDDNGDGRTFNRDFSQSFATWRLRYYDTSGPIPYRQYIGVQQKLPTSGPNYVEGGFDAPRVANPTDAFWQAWIRFRKEVIAHYVQDFAAWITTAADPSTGFTIPAERYYSHQIPGDYIFGQRDSLRLKTSASFLETALIDPIGSPGVTAFNGYDGKRHFKTATPMLFSALFLSSDHWGVFEYNPSIPYDNAIPASDDERYYLGEIRLLYTFRPHVVVPFAWTDLPEHKRYSIKGSAFERALRRFVEEVGDTPWFSWRQVLR